MNYNIEEFELPSSDGIHILKGKIYKPKNGICQGVLQLVHGMCDHVGRYTELAEYLTEKGFAVAGHDQLGHGMTALSGDELGFISEDGGDEYLVRDVQRVNIRLYQIFGDTPIAIMGHSMGSFTARIYSARHPCEISGLIILASGGPKKGIFAGKALVFLMSLIKGKKHRSRLIRALSSKGYNKRFPKNEGRGAWLTRERALAQKKQEDPLANFTFTLAGYRDLFSLVAKANSKSWFSIYPKELPTFIVSGDADPVGGFGKGIARVRDELLRRGHKALEFKLYEGCRHELFGETNREEFFEDIADFLGGIFI